jgi:membrane-associated protease RseP (regulator of RpoE activity)
MAILGTHETGHALTARRRDVKATLPFFIPVPPPIFPFGTLGAVIFMNSPIKNRKALLDVGVAGPLAGFILSLPILIWGLMLSKALPPDAPVEGNFILGPSLLFLFLVRTFFEGAELIDLHPLAIAGWIGLFVTSLNLLPMGQLDGGHVVRGFSTKHYRKVYFGIALLLVGIGVIWPGWIIWSLFVWLITRYEHPGPLDDVSGLDRKRKLLGLIAILILVLTFMPVPILPVELLHLENLNN